MKHLLQKIKMILKNRRFRRIWYRTVGLVSAIMVFITTYAMVLPAITLDVSTARVEPGMAFEQVQYRTPASNVTVAAAENSSDETAVETAAEEVQAEEPEQEEPQAPAEEAAPEETEASEEETSAEAAPVEGDTQTETPVGDTQEEAAPEETEASEEETSAEAAPVEEEPQTEAAPADQPGTTEEAAAAATEQAAQFQIPELSELDFDEILTDRTGFYYYHNENMDTEGGVSSDAVDEWKKADTDTVLAPTDFVRVYLPYEIPAGALNETNQTAHFRLPGNLHITDKQVRAINKFENGIYKETGDSKYLGAEAIEGTRTPDEKLRDGEEEYISALVKVENLSDGGQNLVFTFTPYTIGKNQTAYDRNGQVTAEGQKVKGWFTVDFTVDQIDWDVVDESTETVEAAESGDGSGTEAKTVATTTKSAEIVFTDDIRATLTLEEKEEIAAEAAAETDEDKKAEAEEKAAAAMPAQNFEETVTVKTGKVSDEQTSEAAEALPGKDKLTVRVEAEEGTFPEGTTMKVTPIKGSKLEEVGAAAADAVDGTACGYQAVDISFINADGEEIEPAKAIRVTMTSDSIAKAAEAEKISASPAIVHVADDDLRCRDHDAVLVAVELASIQAFEYLALHLLYGRLLDHEYEEDQILNLFSALEFREMVPLLLMDYQWDENPYIKDCVDNRGTNINGTFALSGSYRTTYKITSETDKTDSVSVLVNQKYYLPSSFTPEQLTDIDSQYAVPDMRLAKPAADALQDLCQAGISNDHPFYVTVSYRSWDDQNDYYQDIAESAGEEEADRNALRAGFSEHQTGLAVNFAATYETDVSFEESDVCKWLVENSSNYGWIQRYPAGLEYITGIGDEPEHFRYLGRDLAKAVQESGLSYDEYYCLYLRGWENESFKPAADILTSVSYYSQSETTEQPAQTDSAAAQETAEPEVTEETTAETPAAEETTEEAQ